MSGCSRSGSGVKVPLGQEIIAENWDCAVHPTALCWKESGALKCGCDWNRQKGIFLLFRNICISKKTKGTWLFLRESWRLLHFHRVQNFLMHFKTKKNRKLPAWWKGRHESLCTRVRFIWLPFPTPSLVKVCHSQNFLPVVKYLIRKISSKPCFAAHCVQEMGGEGF